MRKSKTIYILLSVLLVLCIGVFVVSKIETKKENIKTSGEVFFSIEPSEVTALSWKIGNSEYGFTKNDNWTYDSDEAFPVNEEKIDDLLSVFQDFKASFVIDDNDSSNSYGLNNPEGTISITASDKTYTITLGDYSTMDSQRYVSIDDGKVYLVTHDPIDDFTLDLSNLILNDSIPEFENVSSISFVGDEKYTLTYKENSTDTCCSDDIYFVDAKPLDTDEVEDYLDSISYLSLTDYVTYNASNSDLSTYFLLNPELSCTLNYTVTNEDKEEEDKSFSFSIGCDTDALEKAEEDGDTSNIIAYLRIKDSPIIYEISYNDYESLMEYTYDDLRHSNIVTASFDDIYQIDFNLEGESYSITKNEKSKSNDDEWNYNDEVIEFAELNSTISKLSASEFTSSAEVNKEEISFTLYLHNDNFPEINVALYRYDGDDCVAKVDDKAVALVSRNQVIDLIEAVNGIVLNTES